MFTIFTKLQARTNKLPKATKSTRIERHNVSNWAKKLYTFYLEPLHTDKQSIAICTNVLVNLGVSVACLKESTEVKGEHAWRRDVRELRIWLSEKKDPRILPKYLTSFKHDDLAKILPVFMKHAMTRWRDALHAHWSAERMALLRVTLRLSRRNLAYINRLVYNNSA